MKSVGNHIFLAEVEASPQPGPYADAIATAKTTGTEFWGIWNVLAFHPQVAFQLCELSHQLMFQEAPISGALRELIAAYTSSLNRCDFCMNAHAAVAAHLFNDKELVESVLRDPENSSLKEMDKALLRFVRKLTLESGSIGVQDIDGLKAAGWNEISIYYAIGACALFDFYNRLVSGNGVKMVSEEAFHRLGERERMARVQSWRFSHEIAVPFGQIPRWITYRLLSRSTLGEIYEVPELGLRAHAVLKNLLDGVAEPALVMTDDLEEIGRRLMTFVSPSALEHLAVAILQLERRDETWWHIGGSGDGGSDGLGYASDWAQTGMLQCKWLFNGSSCSEVFGHQTDDKKRVLVSLIHGNVQRDVQNAEFWGRDELAFLVRKHAQSLPMARSLRVTL